MYGANEGGGEGVVVQMMGEMVERGGGLCK